MSAPRKPRLRWHKKADLIHSALFHHGLNTARNLLRQLYLTEAAAADGGVFHTAETYREGAAKDARLLLDIDRLVHFRNGVDELLVYVSRDYPHYTEHLPAARALLAKIGGAA